MLMCQMLLGLMHYYIMVHKPSFFCALVKIGCEWWFRSKETWNVVLLLNSYKARIVVKSVIIVKEFIKDTFSPIVRFQMSYVILNIAFANS